MSNSQRQTLRPAWVEIDLGQLRRNFEIIDQDKPADVHILSVVKDQAYGHGAVQVARLALESGASYLAVSTVDEALEVLGSRDRDWPYAGLKQVRESSSVQDSICRLSNRS